MPRRFLALLALVSGITFAAARPAGAQLAAAASPSMPGQADLNQLVGDAQGWLTDLIHIDTSNPPGNEAQAAQYVNAILQKENIPSEVVELAPGRSFVVGRLQAGPLPNPGTALLLLAHLDVVGVDKSKWTVDPFAGTVKDGYIYGRGAIDDKGMLAANLAAIVALKRAGTRLSRDVIFLADDDEEQGGTAGMKLLIQKYWDKFACGFALNEGGRVVLKDGKVQYVGVQASEKVPYDIAVIASGASGHASIPRADNAIARLALAVGKISAMQAPPQLLTITRRYFEQLSQIEDDDTGKWMRALEMPERSDLAAMRLSDMSPIWGAMLRDTVAPTELHAGIRSDVVPAEASADLDVRLLPGDSIDAMVARLQKAVDDPKIRFQVAADAGITAPPSSLESELLQAITRVAPRQFAGAPVVPMLSPEATDSSELRLHNVQAFGLIPFPLTEADALKMHGEDERLPVASFHAGVEFLYRTVYEFAATK
jgi:acetylornithine deacetylase/succinyl-diaminopimelate desuccinylase-like protein